MNTWLDATLILIVLLGLFMIGSNRLGAIIQVFGIQSVILGTMPFLMYSSRIEIHIVIVSLVAIALKGFLMPYFLFWAIRHVAIRREVSPLIGFGTTLFLSGFLIAGSFILSSRLTFPDPAISDLIIPASFSTIMMGFLLLISRVKAITQVVGYLVIENGIFLFALLLLEKTPFLVEMGILLDVFVGALVMGIVVNHISDHFEHTDTSHLTVLRD
jgi:hydrogenase-4 component E